MSSSLKIEDLYDDSFEGSPNEHQIFSEIFFGNDTTATSKRCLVTGVINFEADSNKSTDISLCSNSDNSSITSQSSSKNLFVEDSYNVTEISGGASGSRCFLERPVSERDDQSLSVKRLKLSVDALSNTRSDIGKTVNSTVVVSEIGAGMSCPVAEVASKPVKLHLVDTSNHGVTSSSYLFKQHVDRCGDVGQLDVLKHRLTSFDANELKETVVAKVIASPLSQESSVTRLGVASPSMTVVDKSESNLHDLGRTNALPADNASLKMETKMDPRSLLHGRVCQLLTEAGWTVEKLKRPSRRYVETQYRSPTGRLFREFYKAWRACGQTIFADRYELLPPDEGKEWTDINKFYNDLLGTLTSIEKNITQSDPANALVHQWSLLDPFVFVVYFDRKIGSLKKGGVVKAARTIIVDRIQENDAALTMDSAYSSATCCNQKSTTHIYNTSIVSKSELTVTNRSCDAHGVQLCNKNLSKYGGQTKDGVSQCLRSVSTSIAYKVTTHAADTSIATDNLSGMSGINRRDVSSSLPPHGLGSKCVLFEDNVEVPVPASAGAGHCREERQNFSESTEIDKVGRHLQNSMVEFVNCRKDGLVHSPGLVDSKVPLHSGKHEDDGENCIEALNLETDSEQVKKKARRKSKKISEMKLLDKSGGVSMVFPEQHVTNATSSHVGAKEVQESLLPDDATRGYYENSHSLSPQHDATKKSSKFKKSHRDGHGPKSGRKKSDTCEIRDDDLLVAAIIKNKDRIHNLTGSSSRRKPLKTRGRGKLKKRKGGCRLLLRNGGKQGQIIRNGAWFMEGTRTILSWMIVSGVISLNDVIQFRDPQNDVVIKDGLVTSNGIICKCCDQVLSVSQFKIHAGFGLNRPCLNLFMDTGKAYTLCQLQAWSAEYKSRKSGNKIGTVEADEDDKNDDSCGLCGEGGVLICCDNCPSAYHQDCLLLQEVPAESWYCSNCTCWLCGGLANDNVASGSFDALKCSQCEHKYHEACLKDRSTSIGVASDTWFCADGCLEVYSGLQSRVGIINQIADGFSWTLLRCIHEDQKVHSAQRLALKAECNSKLAVALTIMEECFQSMVDPRTGIDMIPHVLYNWSSDFARLNFHGFYTVVLEKDDVLISVASVRVHGKAVAEMPLVATCSYFRRKGMCRRLVAAIEEILLSCKVEMLVISAIPALVETWTNGFGFTMMEKEEKQSLNNINLMVFPGTILLKKQLYVDEVGTQSDGEPTIQPLNEGVELEKADGVPIGAIQFDQTDAGDVEGVLLQPANLNQTDDDNNLTETENVKFQQTHSDDQTDAGEGEGVLLQPADLNQTDGDNSLSETENVKLQPTHSDDQTDAGEGVLLQPANLNQTDGDTETENVRLQQTHSDEPDVEAENDGPENQIDAISKDLESDNKHGSEVQNNPLESKNLQDSAGKNQNLQEQFSKLSCDVAQF